VRRAIAIGLVAAAVILAIVPLPPSLVERWFSTGLYPRIQHVLTPLSNRIPFALFDLLVVAAVVAVVVLLVGAGVRARAQRSLRPVVRSLGRLAIWAACAYLVFLFFWGFNYRRVPMTARLDVSPGAATSEAVVALGLDAVNRLNALYSQAHTAGWREPEWRDAQLRAAFTAVQHTLTDAPPAVPGRVKPTIFGPYFRWTNVDGMVDPFALEVLVNPDLLPWERPFVAAHEWSHLAGYADESEASFVGWLTCLHAGPAAQYSGWLYLFWEINGEVGARDRARLLDALAPGPRADVDAIAARLRRGQIPILRNTSWVVYDRYLKANRVDAGIRSYGEVVTLILHARFADGWTPIRRGGPAGPPAPTP
jgi:hypothetical protein